MRVITLIMKEINLPLGLKNHYIMVILQEKRNFMKKPYLLKIVRRGRYLIIVAFQATSIHMAKTATLIKSLKPSKKTKMK